MREFCRRICSGRAGPPRRGRCAHRSAGSCICADVPSPGFTANDSLSWVTAYCMSGCLEHVWQHGGFLSSPNKIIGWRRPLPSCITYSALDLCTRKQGGGYLHKSLRGRSQARILEPPRDIAGWECQRWQGFAHTPEGRCFWRMSA